jgi:lipid-A-disaccharide synthase
LKKVFVSVGEASGDLHAAALIHSLKKRLPELEIFGLGGDLMAAEGVRLTHHVKALAVTGFWEVAKRFPQFRRILQNTIEEVEREKPDLVLLVDYPGMNLRLAKALKPKGFRIVYFILPQVWAWKPDRIRVLAANTDLQLSILPFEKELFSGISSKCEYVGNPLLDRIPMDDEKETFCEDDEISTDVNAMGLLPGSRVDEIRRHYPLMLEAAKRLRDEFPDLQPVTAVRSEVPQKLYRDIEQGSGLAPLHCLRDRYGLLRESSVSIIASGTATLEAALCGTPFCIVYRTAWITYVIAKALINLDVVGLVNIVAGEKVVPEYLQAEMTVDNLTSFCKKMLNDQSAREQMISDLARVRAKLGEPGATERAAERIIAEFGS